MKRLVTASLAGLMTISFAGAAIADDHKDTDSKAEVVERNAKGQATKVKVGETVYTVCMGETQDGCINPREAGLNFGDVPLDYWPGKPASEL